MATPLNAIFGSISNATSYTGSSTRAKTVAGNRFFALPGATERQTSSRAGDTPASPASKRASSGFRDEDRRNRNIEALAAPVAVQPPPQDRIDLQEELTTLVDDLTGLKEKLARGESVDPGLLQRLEACLTDLASTLDIDLDAIAPLDDLAALTGQLSIDDTSLTAKLTRAVVPLTQDILSTGEAAGQLKTVGEKLATLLAALQGDGPDSEKLTALGLPPDSQINGDLKQTLDRLVASASTPQIAASQNLDAPSLRVPNPVAAEQAAQAHKPEAQITLPDHHNTPPRAASSPESVQPTEPSPPPSAKAIKPVPSEPPPASMGAENQQDHIPESPEAGQQPQTLRLDPGISPRAVQAGYQTSQQQLNLPQIAFEITRQAHSGNTRFQIRLDPPELGRIDVKLDIDKSGHIHARLVVEKTETLDLMQRDQRGLERALQQAGLEGSKTSLEFSLRQNPPGHDAQDRSSRLQHIALESERTDESEEVAPTINLYRGNLSASGVNIIA